MWNADSVLQAHNADDWFERRYKARFPPFRSPLEKHFADDIIFPVFIGRQLKKMMSLWKYFASGERNGEVENGLNVLFINLKYFIN